MPMHTKSIYGFGSECHPTMFLGLFCLWKLTLQELDNITIEAYPLILLYFFILKVLNPKIHFEIGFAFVVTCLKCYLKEKSMSYK